MTFLQRNPESMWGLRYQLTFAIWSNDHESFLTPYEFSRPDRCMRETFREDVDRQFWFSDNNSEVVFDMGDDYEDDDSIPF